MSLQAPSARLDAYLQGRLPQAAPAGNLAVQLDQNLQLLQILGAEMRGLHLEMDTALQVRGVGVWAKDSALPYSQVGLGVAGGGLMAAVLPPVIRIAGPHGGGGARGR